MYAGVYQRPHASEQQRQGAPPPSPIVTVPGTAPRGNPDWLRRTSSSNFAADRPVPLTPGGGLQADESRSSGFRSLRGADVHASDAVVPRPRATAQTAPLDAPAADELRLPAGRSQRPPPRRSSVRTATVSASTVRSGADQSPHAARAPAPDESGSTDGGWVPMGLTPRRRAPLELCTADMFDPLSSGGLRGSSSWHREAAAASCSGLGGVSSPPTPPPNEQRSCQSPPRSWSECPPPPPPEPPQLPAAPSLQPPPLPPPHPPPQPPPPQPPPSLPPPVSQPQPTSLPPQVSQPPPPQPPPLLRPSQPPSAPPTRLVSAPAPPADPRDGLLEQALQQRDSALEEARRAREERDAAVAELNRRRTVAAEVPAPPPSLRCDPPPLPERSASGSPPRRSPPPPPLPQAAALPIRSLPPSQQLSRLLAESALASAEGSSVLRSARALLSDAKWPEAIPPLRAAFQLLLRSLEAHAKAQECCAHGEELPAQVEDRAQEDLLECERIRGILTRICPQNSGTSAAAPSPGATVTFLAPSPYAGPPRSPVAAAPFGPGVSGHPSSHVMAAAAAAAAASVPMYVARVSPPAHAHGQDASPDRHRSPHRVCDCPRCGGTTVSSANYCTICGHVLNGESW
eukprot:TRINITY_DN8538_c3_g1_i1.p1 TRINITY_DN8538_c3_g1~~TRINITY_DN8538_c3_g1_i1.p1  ORF type:complete len:629 (+),score=141.33 TRINITY_DN8538_c3_g1_i1:49-1935(+)